MSSQFHFSPRPNRAHEIRWRPWGPEAFAEAAREDKPVLLGISAVWCHWCHVMDETSYSDQQVIDLISERFVAIRVDNDQRPDINARYNMGGWPTTAFLTPDGEALAGFTYVPPDQMRQALDQISTHYGANRDEIEAKVRQIQEGRRRAMESMRGGGDLSSDIVDQVQVAMGDAYDPVYGGFGNAPKFPHTDAVDLLLHLHQRKNDPDLLHMARKTLERMAQGGVFDQEWGGFFRYSTNRDWSVPHFEKMLEDNANLLRNLLRLYRITADPAYAAVASRVIDYLDRWLSDPDTGAFYGSQDADEEFYALSAPQRQKRPAPYVDRTVYTSWCAMAISAYLEASWTLPPKADQPPAEDRPGLAERALRGLAFLWEKLRTDGQGMHRYHDGAPHVLGLLGDQAYTARALLDAYEVSGDALCLERAEELAALLASRFADADNGGFFDTWEGHESLGRLGLRQKPLAENAVCAEVLLRLHQLTRRPDYLDVARRTLETFVGHQESLGHFAASYARVVDLFLNPQAEIKVVGDIARDSDLGEVGRAARALHQAALRLPGAARTVQALHPQRDAARLTALALPASPSPVAYACFGTLCSAPVNDPATLAPTVEELRKAQSGETIFSVAAVDPETAD